MGGNEHQGKTKHGRLDSNNRGHPVKQKVLLHKGTCQRKREIGTRGQGGRKAFSREKEGGNAPFTGEKEGGRVWRGGNAEAEKTPKRKRYGRIGRGGEGKAPTKLGENSFGKKLTNPSQGQGQHRFFHREKMRRKKKRGGGGWLTQTTREGGETPRKQRGGTVYDASTGKEDR